MDSVHETSELDVFNKGYLFLCIKEENNEWKRLWIVLKSNCLYAYALNKQKLIKLIPLSSSLKILDIMSEYRPPSQFSLGTYCDKCKIEFTLFKRRHHCRNCAQCFCSDHSSQQIEIPQRGIFEPTRTCDNCFNEILKDLEDIHLSTITTKSLANKTFKLVDMDRRTQSRLTDTISFDDPDGSWAMFNLPVVSPNTFPFAIKTLEQEIWFSAESFDSMKEWVALIKGTITSIRANPLSVTRQRRRSKDDSDLRLNIEDLTSLAQRRRAATKHTNRVIPKHEVSTLQRNLN